MNLYEADDKLHSLMYPCRAPGTVHHQWYVNKKHWRPVAIPESAFRQVMSKKYFSGGPAEADSRRPHYHDRRSLENRRAGYNLFTTEPYKQKPS